MKRKPILRRVLISLAVLIVAAVAAVAWGLFCDFPGALDRQDKMINAVRYIGLVQTDEFYDEIMSLPDGYIRASNLKTKLASPTPETPETYGYRYLIKGSDLLQGELAGRVYVKKEGRFLCVAAITESGKGLWGERYEKIRNNGGSITTETGEGTTFRIEDWGIDPRELLSHGIQFN